ncbi:hypothetical protein FHK02_337 [Spirosoma sp. LMG 31448]|uniref:Uncharacterized protein n=1 Tax=Spirosoma utsteinense TaxID=2585773 RepID=A0ABR6W9D1_9BACT|nr:hypothetical protein [Spirosoma utsteinense]MBC3792566.1 hypothetical protein [Spirosoma utsteinense]
MLHPSKQQKVDQEARQERKNSSDHKIDAPDYVFRFFLRADGNSTLFRMSR